MDLSSHWQPIEKQLFESMQFNGNAVDLIFENELKLSHSNHWNPIENQALESFGINYSNHWKPIEHQSFESLQTWWKSINLIIAINLTINKYNDWKSMVNQSFSYHNHWKYQSNHWKLIILTNENLLTIEHHSHWQSVGNALI